MPITLREAGAFKVVRGPVVLQGPVVTRASIFTGEWGEFLARLDKRSGRQIWRKRMSGHIWSAHGDKVLIYSGNAKETQLWNEDGEIIWRRSGRLGPESGRLFDNAKGQLRTIDVLTGQVIDEFECPPGRPNLMHDGVLLLTNQDGSIDPVQAVDLSRRAVVWQKDLTSDVKERYGDACPRGLSFLASLPGRVVAKSGQHLVAVSLVDGGFGWGLPLSVPYVTMAREGRIYTWSAPSDGTSTRVTFDLDSGQTVRETSAPSASENRLVIVDEASGQIVVDRPLASYGPAFRGVQEAYGGTLCKEHVVFTTRSGLMAVFRLWDGELVWQHQHRDQLFSPAFEENRLYVACADGTLVIIEAEGGEL